MLRYIMTLQTIVRGRNDPSIVVVVVVVLDATDAMVDLVASKVQRVNEVRWVHTLPPPPPPLLLINSFGVIVFVPVLVCAAIV